ncbi:FeoA family protein [Vibrio sp. TH_r3]|uniref:FeoA family protein n=1 Tax=Vibrio sp. TH_r3 TaxID=3082084 RepID=UPI00295326F6|nr:FeoA family protein [Vibrio sp. TH_r3]MDV7105583.1 FeoA family protein [Vibrio sp. TH_r3]
MNSTIAHLLPQKIATFFSKQNAKDSEHSKVKNLSQAELNREYEIESVIQDDQDIVNFLFTLGCFKGQSVTLVSVLSDTYVISIKDARYSIDSDLAKMVILV